jgi:hypothetical protein
LDQARTDENLRVLVARWPSLPEPIRRAILNLLDL